MSDFFGFKNQGVKNTGLSLKSSELNQHGNGKSPFLIGNTSSTGSIFHCYVRVESCFWCSNGYIFFFPPQLDALEDVFPASIWIAERMRIRIWSLSLFFCEHLTIDRDEMKVKWCGDGVAVRMKGSVWMEFFDDDGTSGLVVKGNPSKLKFAYLFFHQTAPMKTSGIIVRGFLNIFACGWGPLRVFGQEQDAKKTCSWLVGSLFSVWWTNPCYTLPPSMQKNTEDPIPFLATLLANDAYTCVVVPGKT